MQITHPDVWRMMYPAEESAALLSQDEQLALQNTYFILNFFERLYMLHRDGVIDDERWKAWEVWIHYSLTNSALFRDVWDESCGIHHADFVAFVEENYDDGACKPADDQGDLVAGTPAAVPVN